MGRKRGSMKSQIAYARIFLALMVMVTIFGFGYLANQVFYTRWYSWLFFIAAAILAGGFIFVMNLLEILSEDAEKGVNYGSSRTFG